MKKTKKSSWIEIIPSNAVGKEMKHEDRDVVIIQSENTGIMSEDGLLLLCEVMYK